MAVVWYAVNLDKCERVDPKRMGEIPTWVGWVNDGPEGGDPGETFPDGRISQTRRWVHRLIASGHWSNDDEIRLVSTEPEEGPAGSVAWLGKRTDRAADYIGPEWSAPFPLWNDAPHPDVLKAPAPTLVPVDEDPLPGEPLPLGFDDDPMLHYRREHIRGEDPLVMPADAPATERGMLGVPMVGEHSPPQRLHREYEVVDVPADAVRYSRLTLLGVLDPPPKGWVRAAREALREQRQEEAVAFWRSSEAARTTDDEPPASVEELLASHPGPWRIEWGTDGADAVRVVDPLGQVVAMMPGRYLAAAQLLVDVRASGSAVDLLTSGGGE